MTYDYIVQVGSICMWLSANSSGIQSVLNRKDLVAVFCQPYPDSGRVELHSEHFRKIKEGTFCAEYVSDAPMLSVEAIREKYFTPSVVDTSESRVIQIDEPVVEEEPTVEEEQPVKEEFIVEEEQPADEETSFLEDLIPTCTRCKMVLSQEDLDSEQAFEIGGQYFCSLGCYSEHVFNS